MVTEAGKRLRELAEKMSAAPLGTGQVFQDVQGQNRNLVKDGDGGQRAGWDYSLEALGARQARGENVEAEIKLLIKRAKKLKIDDPEQTVRVAVDSWKFATQSVDERNKE